MALDYSKVYGGQGGLGALSDNLYNQFDEGGNLVQMMSDGQNGNRALTQDDIDSLVQKQQQQYQDVQQGVTKAGGVWAGADPSVRPSNVPGSWVQFNAPNGGGSYWGPTSWEAPHWNDSFFSGHGFFAPDAYDPRALISEMPGLPILLAPLAGAAAGAGAASSDAALAGGGEVGSGYAASAPAASAGAAGGAAGGSTFAAADPALAGGGEVGSGYAASAPGASGATGSGAVGTSSAQTLTGSTAKDTLGGNTMFDDYGNPLDMSGTGTDPYGTGVDQYGNPTGQYANYGDPNVSYADQGDPGSFGDNSNLSGMMQQAKALAAQAGITPAAALKYLAGALGRGAPAALGAVGANRQANSLQALNQQYMAMGAPSRARYEASFDPNFTMMNDPGYADALNAASKASLHSLSVQGNPAGSPNAWAQTLSDVNSKFAYPALTQYRNQNAATGGIATFNAAAPGTAAGAIDARGNVLNAVGAGINDIFNPRPSLAQILAQYGKAA